jgi:hypothetical protein
MKLVHMRCALCPHRYEAGSKFFNLEKKKAAPVGTARKRQEEGGKVSGKAMHGVEAKAKTLGLETTTILDEDYDHSKVCDLFLLL